MNRTARLVAAVAALLPLVCRAQGAEPAPPQVAERPSAAPSEGAKGTLELAPKVGGLVPWSKLKPTVGFDLELGYVTPLIDHQLAVVVDVGYSQPTHGTQVTDTRVGSSAYTFTLTQRELNLFVGPKFFILPTDAALLPYVGAGVKVQLMRSDIVGAAGGQAFGDGSETKTQVGGALRGGLGLQAGPGHIIGELEVAYAGLQETVTGTSNAADVGLQLGYMFIF